MKVKDFNWETNELGDYKYITEEDWCSLDEGEWLNAPIGFIKPSLTRGDQNERQRVP